MKKHLIAVLLFAVAALGGGNLQKAIGTVTRADVLRVSREYLKPEHLTIVAVGNPKKFSQPLSALGMPVHPIDLTIPEPKEVPGGQAQ